jgi:hypothetical protein
MLRPIELLQQVVKAVGQGLVHDGIVELSQAFRPTRLFGATGMGRTAWRSLTVIHSPWLTQNELHHARPYFLPIRRCVKHRAKRLSAMELSNGDMVPLLAKACQEGRATVRPVRCAVVFSIEGSWTDRC